MGIAVDNALLLARMQHQQDKIGRLADRINQLEATLDQAKVECDEWRERLDTLLMISESTYAHLFSEQGFEQIADTLLEITGFSMLGVQLFDEQTRCYRLVAHRGVSTEVVRNIRTSPCNRGDFLSIVAQTAQPLFTSDYASDPRSAQESVSQAGMRSLAFIPLLAADRFLGVFVLASTEEVAWHEAHIRWLASIGRQLGLIIHHGELSKQLRVSATLEERVRLGRELHDSLAQVLGYLYLKSQLAQAQLSSQKLAQAMGELMEMEEVSAQAYDEVRLLIFGLRISPSLGQDLVTALQEYAHEFEKRSRIRVSLDAEHWTHPSLAPETEAQFLRIFQEALTNVRRHAQASHVQLSFRVDGEVAYLGIKDDGKGFAPVLVGEDSCQHLGMQMMKERAESVGATLKLYSRRGQGTEVLIELPLCRSEKEGV
jgi:two-component system nitrate/nitrite sensor histidine kinase NarX